MKQFLKYISFSLVLALGFTSCDADDDNQLDDVRDVGGYAHLTNTRISQFDTDSDLNIDIFTASGVTAETVEIIHDGAVIGTADISGETATFSSSVLGDIAAGSYPVRVRATFSNGNVSERPFTITVVNSLTISADNPDEASLTELPEVELDYDTYNLAATIDNVDLHLKNGSAGTYMDAGVDVDGAVEVGDTNYQQLNLAVNDTLYYRFTATSGTLSQSAESYIVIVEESEDEDEDGDTDGDEDGDTDGDEDGDTDGDTDGDEDGDEDGDTDGDTDGDEDGDEDGDTDGDTDGDEDGDEDGDTDGDTDGDEDGDSDGDEDGDEDEDDEE
jgi:hypothetical protein